MDQGTVQSCAVAALIRQFVELLRECYLNMLIPTWPLEAHPSKRSVHPRSLWLALSIRFGNRKARQGRRNFPAGHINGRFGDSSTRRERKEGTRPAVSQGTPLRTNVEGDPGPNLLREDRR